MTITYLTTLSSIDQVATTSGLYKSPKYSISELNPDLLPKPEDISYLDTLSPPQISLVRKDLPPPRPPVHKQLSAAEDVTPDTTPGTPPDNVRPNSEQIPRSRSPLSFVSEHFSKILSRPEGAGRWSGGRSGSASGTVFYTGNHLAALSSDIVTATLDSTLTSQTVDSRDTQTDDTQTDKLSSTRDLEGVLDSYRDPDSDIRTREQLVTRPADLK